MADQKDQKQPKEEAEAPQEEPKTPKEEPKVEPKQDDPKDEKEALENSKNPERTKEYIEKLQKEKEQYKKLYEGYDEPTTKAPSAQNYNNLNQQQVNQVFQGMVDQDGYLDGNKLAQVLDQMNRRADAAEKAAKDSQKRLRDFEETENTRKVYKKHPELDPNGDQFDSKYFNYVYNELAVKAKAGEEPTASDYEKAADKVYNDLYGDREVTKKEKEQKETTDEQKKQSSSVRPNSPSIKGYYDDQEDEALIKKVRQGKKGALAELLSRRGQ